jgi:hypothetical protein
MSDEQGSEITDPGGEKLRQELARNVAKPSEVPSGYQLEGPGSRGQRPTCRASWEVRVSASSPKMRTSRTIDGPSTLGEGPRREEPAGR